MNLAARAMLLALTLLVALAPATGAADDPIEPTLKMTSSSLDPTEVEVGDAVEIQVSLKNVGNVSFSGLVVFEPGTGDELVTLVSSPLPPGGAIGLGWSYVYDSPDRYRVKVNGISLGNVTVTVPPVPAPKFAVLSHSVEPREVLPRDPVTFTATVANVGTAAGAKDMTLALDGEPYVLRSVDLGAGTETNLSGTFPAPSQEGNYTLTLGGMDLGYLNVTLDAQELLDDVDDVVDDTVGNGTDDGASGDTGDTGSTGQDEGEPQQMVPGAGTLAALATLGAAALARRRRAF